MAKKKSAKATAKKPKNQTLKPGIVEANASGEDANFQHLHSPEQMEETLAGVWTKAHESRNCAEKFSAELIAFIGSPRSLGATHPLRLAFHRFLLSLPATSVQFYNHGNPQNFDQSKYLHGHESWVQLVVASEMNSAQAKIIATDFLCWFSEEYLGKSIDPKQLIFGNSAAEPISASENSPTRDPSESSGDSAAVESLMHELISEPRWKSPNVPRDIIDLSTDLLRQRAWKAWDFAYTLRIAIDAWKLWVETVDKLRWESVPADLASLCNDVGNQICIRGRDALRGLGKLNLKEHAFAAEQEDEHSGTILESGTPISSWPMPPRECIDKTHYFSPSWPIKEVIANGLALLVILDRAAASVIKELEMVPDAAFSVKVEDGKPKVLSVDIQRRQIIFNGKTFNISSEQACRWVKVLCDHPGQWISGTNLHVYDVELDGARTDQLRAFLPIEIVSIIESQRGAGSRLLTNA